MFEIIEKDSCSTVIKVIGVGGAGGNAIEHMIRENVQGVEFICVNTDAQALKSSSADIKLQIGPGLGAGGKPEKAREYAEPERENIADALRGAHMVFITAGMGGGTGTGAAPVIARAAKEQGILTVGVVTKPFHFEGARRQATAERGIEELARYVDTLIVIPNQNLFRVANEKTTFAAAFAMADQVLYSGVASITELMTKEGLINLDFADVRAIMSEMGKAMMGTGEASGDKRAIEAAEAAISNPLLDDVSMRGARGLLISICGGPDLTLYEVDEAATRIREEVDPEANIILGATFDDALEGTMRVSVVATGLRTEAGSGEHHHEVEDKSRGSEPERKTYSIPQPSAHVKVARAAPIVARPAPQPVVQVEEPVMEEENHEENYQEEVVMAPPKPIGRIPSIDQFPRIAQQQVAAQQHRIETIAENANKKRRGLFERLAEVGLGRKIEQEPAPQRAAPAARRAEPKMQPQAQVLHEAPVEPEATYDDDQLAIPAFLRRQASN